MAKLVNRITAAEAKAKAESVNGLLSRLYDDIREAAEYNRYSTWFFFGELKVELVVEAVKDLRSNGFQVELFEEKEDTIDETVARPRGANVISALLGKDEVEEENKEEKKEKVIWRDILISWE